MSHIGVYLRVSTRKQDTRSQEPDLKRWLDAFANGSEVRWYRDTASGKSMDRPGWKKLEAELNGGNVSQVVVWRLDRLGRTASGLTALFEKLVTRRVGLVSLKDGFDLSTASGRLLANLLASVAAFELELRAERVLAGQAAARTAGKRWGGSKSGRRISVTDEQLEAVRRLKAEGCGVAVIARATGLSRPTIYSILDASRG
ncbi:MAG: recombinase family protein [Planctomycetia bacterium]|nr:recombinase family protein [Planctomycetia bacterium]